MRYVILQLVSPGVHASLVSMRGKVVERTLHEHDRCTRFAGGNFVRYDSEILDSRLRVLSSELRGHVRVLREQVFGSSKFLPQFDLLLSDILGLRETYEGQVTVVSLERMLLYGKNLFAPFFARSNFVSLDSSPLSADARGAYNAHLVDHQDFVVAPCESIRCPVDTLDFPDGRADLVLVPNLVHHVENQVALWSETARILKPGATLYVFEPTLREVHQDPDDFIRYTPSGLRSALSIHGMQTVEVTTTGGPFSAIAYCWTQALQYIAPDTRKDWSEWFAIHYEDLIGLEQQFPTNLVREYTSFPTAFSLKAVKL